MERGQASIEYVGAVALVGLVLALATAVAAPDLPRTVVHHLRVGLCIVGGDVCRTADARRAGLEPCVTGAREADKRSRITIATLTYATGKAFAVERRSDGSARVMLMGAGEGGVSVGLAGRLGPHANLGGEIGGSLGFTSGYAWELPDERALRRFLAGAKQSPGRLGWDLMRKGVVAPTERFRAVSGSVGAEAGGEAGGVEQSLVAASGRAAIGRRTRGDRTTWYFDASDVGPHLFPDVTGEGAWAIELTDDPRELRVTSQLTGDVEIEARLDLSLHGNAAVARALLQRPSPARARALGRHMGEHGVVQRRRYRVRELPSDPDLGVKLGILGVDHGGEARERTLVSAEVLHPGGSARRADCLGL